MGRDLSCRVRKGIGNPKINILHSHKNLKLIQTVIQIRVGMTYH